MRKNIGHELKIKKLYNMRTGKCRKMRYFLEKSQLY